MANNENDNDLTGFKDFLEVERKKNDGRHTPRTRSDGFELLTFLEQDSKRVEKFIQVFEEKSYVLKNNPQEVAILAEISNHRDLLRLQLIEVLAKDSGVLFENLGDIFRNHFNK